MLCRFYSLMLVSINIRNLLLSAVIVGLFALPIPASGQTSADSDGVFQSVRSSEQGEFIRRTLEHDGRTRTYNLYVPAAYDGQKDWPLVISYHGFSWGIHTTGDASQPRLDNLRAVADTAHVLIAYPLGLRVTIGMPQGIRTNTGWNDDGEHGDWDDVAFTSALIDHIDADYAVDLRRVHATGMSSGSRMVFTLACRLADRIASIAGATGPMVETFFVDGCPARRSVSILLIHGTDDRLFPYTGYPFDDFAPRPIPETPTFWARHNGCSTDSLVADLPDVVDTDFSTVTRIEYPDCDDETEVVFYRVNNGGHTWPRSPYTHPILGIQNMDIDATALIWEFFKRNPHPIPRPAFEHLNTTLVGYWAPDSAEFDLSDVVVSDDVALVSSWYGYGNGEVWRLDTSDPVNPAGAIFLDHGMVPRTMALSGNFAYMGGDIYDVSDPSNPNHISSFDTHEGGGKIAVDDGMAFWTWLGEEAGAGGLQIIDVSVPAHPVEASSLDLPISSVTAPQIAVGGDYVYVASPIGTGGLHIVDISDPVHPTVTAFDTRWGGLWGLAIEGSLLFVGKSNVPPVGSVIGVQSDSSLAIIDVSDPANPEQIADVPVALWDVDVVGDFVYVAAGKEGLRIFDVGDPAHPQEAGFFATAGEALAVTVTDEYVYVVAFDGMYIIRHDPARSTSIEEGPATEVPATFLLHQNYPNPFNPTTTIAYTLPRSSDVTLSVYDVLGRQVRVLASGMQPAGTYPVSFDATGLSSGLYVYRLQAGDYVETKRMVVIK